MKKFTRDDTEHGKEYYLASDVDALMAQPAPYMAVSNERMSVDPHTGNVSIGTVVQRTWVDLTDDEIDYIMAFVSPHCDEIDFARAIEAKLKEKNT
jgi:hypothetical protein